MSDRQRPPTSFERRLLVWYKKFPGYEQVPPIVERGILDRVRTKFRIHLNIATMVISVFGFGYYAYSGKKAVHEGEGIHSLNVKMSEIDANPESTNSSASKKGI